MKVRSQPLLILFMMCPPMSPPQGIFKFPCKHAAAQGIRCIVLQLVYVIHGGQISTSSEFGHNALIHDPTCRGFSHFFVYALHLRLNCNFVYHIHGHHLLHV